MKRYRYFDILRIAACCLIVYYHIGTGLEEWLPDRMPAWPMFIGSNIHVADFAVTVFFMLSGAGLSLSVLAKPPVRPADFYVRRFRRIMPPFYIAYAAVFLLRFLLHLADHSPLFPEQIPVWRFVFTLLGLDGWMSYHGAATFYLGVGEWFIGCLILLYLLFPLMHWLMTRFPAAFGFCAAFLFVVSWLFFLDDNAFSFRLCEFAFGMLIGAYCPLIPRWFLIPAVPAMIRILIWPEELQDYHAVINILAVLAFLVIVSALEPVFEKLPFPPLRLLSDLSYEVFLIHHVVISWLSRLWAERLPRAGIPLLILTETAATLLAAAALHLAVRRRRPEKKA